MRQTSQIDEDFNFTEVRTEREEKDQEWILGGQDACHVSTILQGQLQIWMEHSFKSCIYLQN